MKFVHRMFLIVPMFTGSIASAQISSPEGLQIEKLATLESPRLFAFSRDGDLIVGSKSGKIYRLKAPYTSPEVISEFGGYPHSVAFRVKDGVEELWVAETGGLYKVAYGRDRRYARHDFQFVAELPGGGGHTSRTIKIRRDGTVFVSLGITGNCSIEYLDDSYGFQQRRGGIFRLDEGGNRLVPFGKGLRNPIGFSFHPQTAVMWSNNNGPDHWGYDYPREAFVEVNEGDFFGMPWYQTINGQVVRDNCAPDHTVPLPPDRVKRPAVTFDAHVAPIDTTFIPPNDPLLKAEWANSAVVAIHGTGGAPPSGGDAARRPPKIVLVEFSGGRPTGRVKDLIGGFQDPSGYRRARPAGVGIGPGGALFFTSDADNPGIYRATMRSPSTGGGGAREYTIRVQESGKCIDIPGAQLGTRLKMQQWECNGTGAQRFRAVGVGGGYWNFVSTISGKCLDVTGGSPDNGAPIQTWDCNGLSPQKFRLEDRGGGWVAVIAQNSQKAWDIDLHSAQWLQQWTPQYHGRQLFGFFPVSGGPIAGTQL
jgi:glucose/arabinose dehydrogenase